MTVSVRPIEMRDEPRWRALWDGYCRFYERDLSGPVTQYTWSRIVDPASPVYAIVAETENEGVVGMANYILHENTWALTPVCYLEDLFVEPRHRGVGIGARLIDWLRDQMAAQGWSRIYWHTRANNYRARGLYDKYTPESGFVRYVIVNPAA